MPLRVHGKDNHCISVTRPAQITVETELPFGEIKVTKKNVGNEHYINPINEGFMTDACLIDSFFEEEKYKEFLPDGAVDEDVLGELPSGIEVSPREVVTAMLHAAAGTWRRLLHQNLVDSKVGYLSGRSSLHLCSVIRMHTIHSPSPSYDLNTLHCAAAMENGLSRLHGLSLVEARESALMGLNRNGFAWHHQPPSNAKYQFWRFGTRK